MQKKDLILLIVLTFVLFSLIFLFSYKYVLYNKGFYEEEFSKNGVYEKYNKADVDEEHDKIMEFLLTTKSIGETKMLSEQGIQHLKDVKILMRNIEYFSYFIVIVVFGLFAYLHFKHKKKDILFAKATLFSGIISSVVLLILYFLSRNFNWFFVKFHEIAFSNDLWLMDPEKTMLVNLYPDQFWWDAFAKIIWIVMIVSVMFVLMGGIGWYFLKKREKQKEKNRKKD